MKTLLAVWLVLATVPACAQTYKVVDVPMQPAPVVEVQPAMGVLGIMTNPRDNKIMDIYPGSDLNRFPFVQINDIISDSSDNGWKQPGPIGSYVRLQVLTKARSNSIYLQGHVTNIMVQRRDPRLFRPYMDRLKVPTTNHGYYGQVQAANDSGF